MTLRVFVGVDPRQPLAFTVCASSILRRSPDVSVQPIGLLPIPGFTRNGLTTFSFSRYLVPHLCNYEGRAIFMDGDIIVRADVNELAALADPACAVSVAKHVARFEWPSVMVFNNELCRQLTVDWVNDPANNPAQLDWAPTIGTLPPEWNHCVLYEPHREDAKLIHFTAGLPMWPETVKSPHADKWIEEWQHANGSVSWEELMGKSVHVGRIVELNRG